MLSRCLAVAAALAHLDPGAAAAPRALPEGFISGTVTSSRGPEAGVWVIAETDELKTPFIKIVVTDDEGATRCRSSPRRPTTSGCAVTGSSTRHESRAGPATPA